MHIYEKLGVHRYINAHDTYTVYGGSRMNAETIAAMVEAADSFVDMYELQVRLGEKIAEMTNNEAAYVANSATGAMMLAAAAILCRGDMYLYSQLPDVSQIPRNEIIIIRSQKNAYVASVAASGARIVEVGDADETLDWMLEGAINDRTAAIFYFPNLLYERASMPLEKVVEIAKRNNIPVVADAASQLPPKENLWKYTQMGVDLAIFSGGKSICGPQASGLILGRKELIDFCIRFGAPVHGICRSCKGSRESMIGLLVALQQYLSMDHQKHWQELSKKTNRLVDIINSTKLLQGFRVEYGPVGQTVPRAFGRLPSSFSGHELFEAMKNEGVFVGFDKVQKCMFLNPLNLTDEEIDIVETALLKCVAALEFKAKNKI